jgi:hypothetical protein
MNLLNLYLTMITIIILSGSIGFLVYSILNRKTTLDYQNKKFIYYYNKNENNKKEYCPDGCNKGQCSKSKDCKDFYKYPPKCCVHNIQCKNCRDKKTGQYYFQDLNNVIIKPYKTDEEESNSEIIDSEDINPEKIKELNNIIKKRNIKISEMNKNIKNNNELIKY